MCGGTDNQGGTPQAESQHGLPGQPGNDDVKINLVAFLEDALGRRAP
jgi:hypothetical protein